MQTFHWSPNRRRDRLISATLCCRLCSRSMGDLVGYANRPLEEARFIPTPTGTLPQAVNRELRCAHCNGRLSLDDVEPLGRGVSLAEVGGIRLSHILMSPRTRSRTPGA